MLFWLVSSKVLITGRALWKEMVVALKLTTCEARLSRLNHSLLEILTTCGAGLSMLTHSLLTTRGAGSRWSEVFHTSKPSSMHDICFLKIVIFCPRL